MPAIPEPVKVEFAKEIGIEPADLVVTLHKPLEIQSNRLYDIWAGTSHFIAKEYLRQDEQESAPRREYQALRLLSGLDLAPQPAFYDPGAGPVVIYHYMAGEMWDRRPVDKADLSRLLDTWLKVHAVRADWWARGAERPINLEINHTGQSGWGILE